MSTTASNENLHRAREAKKDEFYTQLEDIEKELRHYKGHFKDKTVFLNCDDPYESNFFKYFAMNFNYLGLKKLISVSYAGSKVAGGQLLFSDIAGIDEDDVAYKVEITEVPDLTEDGTTGLMDVEELLKSDANTSVALKGDGDFRSTESIELLKEADIVVTNPPFSLFREYLAQLVEYEKDFLVLGNMNSITHKEMFPLVLNKEVWTGVTNFNKGIYFFVPEDFEYRDSYRFEKRDSQGRAIARVPGICWFTNLDNNRRHEEIPLFRRYHDDPTQYPRYENYDAIEVSRVADIPEDYDGDMGVPITFLGKHNPEQFEIIGQSRVLANPITIDGRKVSDLVYYNDKDEIVYPFMRIVIRNLRPNLPDNKEPAQ